MNSLPICVSIAEAAKLAGLGRTSLYVAIGEGKIKTRRFCRRVLIETDSIRSFIANLPETKLAA